MVRLGPMAMAAQLRPAGQRRAAAAAMGSRAQCSSQSGGYSPGKPSYANYADTQDLRQEQGPTEVDSGGEKLNPNNETAVTNVYEKTYQKALGRNRRRFVTDPTAQGRTANMNVDAVTHEFWVKLATAIYDVTWRATGCSLALTPPRSA